MTHGDNTGIETARFTESALLGLTEPGHASALGTSEPSGSGLTGDTTLGTGGLTNRSRTDPAPEDELVRSIKQFEAVVESFWRGKTTKTNALSSILRILGEDTHVSVTQSQKDATFDSYLAEILLIQAAHDEFDRDHDQPPPDEGSSKRVPKKSRESAESDSEDGDDKPTKKQRLLESDMPWYCAPVDTTAASSNPSCQETCRLLRAYNRDISKAKFYIKIAPKSPSGIPSSQWERILKGDAVDLNQIYASLHHVVPDEERTGRMGDAEITFGVPEAKKRVRTAADWSAAWHRAAKAIGFAFPHRKEELAEYGEYINEEFSSKLLSAHHKLILYDTAVRNKVGAGQHFLLTDFGRFNRLYSAIVLPEGIEGQPAQPSNKKGSKTQQSNNKSEICNKYNSGTCKNSDADCKYRHVCKKCRKSGHPEKDCTGGAWENLWAKTQVSAV
jgi:hypothetical protein